MKGKSVLKLSICLAVLLAAAFLPIAAAAAQAQTGVRWQDYNGKRIGVLVGPLMEDAAAEFFPDSEYFYFNSYPDCSAALLAGKIDGFLGDEPGMISMHAEMPEIDYIHESLTENNYSFAFRKDDPKSAALCEELNEFLAQSWADGTMEEIGEIWLGVDEDKKVVELSGLTGENGTIRVVTTSTDMPWSYVKDGQNVGYDIDLVAQFCRARGYALELGDVDFAGRIPAIQSGKYDFTTDMNVTPEREEQVLFSSPTAHGGIVLAVLASDLAATASGEEEGSGSFFDSVRSSFEKTFLREDRWKLFLEGIGTTLLITALAILLGTALGFGVYMLCRNGNSVANTLTRFFTWLIQGMPVVVLLMILYYIVFAGSTISGTAVAVIGFTLVFGAAVYAMLRAGVGAVPKGQTEAAYDTAVELLRRVGVADKALNYPDELSGGQQQRVAIARTLAMNPEIILLDEPTSALDPAMVEEVQAVIRDLSRSGKTMMIVTHEMNFARAISNRVFYMDEGGIYEGGTPEQIFDHSERELTRRFIKKLKVLEFTIDTRDFDFIGAGGEIDRYCLQNDVAPREKYRVRLVIEELVQQILLPQMEQPRIHVLIEHSVQEGSTAITIAYAGERFDPKDTENELSFAVLKSTAEEMAYTYDEKGSLPNRVEMRLK